MWIQVTQVNVHCELTSYGSMPSSVKDNDRSIKQYLVGMDSVLVLSDARDSLYSYILLKDNANITWHGYWSYGRFWLSSILGRTIHMMKKMLCSHLVNENWSHRKFSQC